MDDRRQTGVEGDTVVVNMAIASSHASIYQECVEKTGQSGIEVPSYTWFLLQSWPCSGTTANMHKIFVQDITELEDGTPADEYLHDDS